VICEQLGAAGLNGPNVRVVLEKPLGHDLASAQEINRVVRSVFSERRPSASTTTWASPRCRT
jgi:glucose-6-phosphate 1-dehydrogenase